MSFSKEFEGIEVEAMEDFFEITLRCKKCLTAFKIKVKMFTEQGQVKCPKCSKSEMVAFS